MIFNTTKAVIFITIFCLFMSSPLIFGFRDNGYEVKALKISEKVNLDGCLNEPIWGNAQKVNKFIQREPLEGEPATELTEVSVLYDDEFLYIGAVCYDSHPNQIVANEMRRDAELNNNDYFEVIIDTFSSRRNGFYFAVNPVGARQDALIRDDGSNINKDWDGVWRARTRISEKGWQVEIAIPFYTLRFKKKEIQDWGINFGRHIARKREEVFWTPILRDYGREGNYRVSYFGRLAGLVDLHQGSRLQVMPYIIGGGEKADRYDSFSSDADVGLDVKYRLSSNLTADITINTDFAQVEADQEKFNLTRFSLYFPEKRRFFLEGADIFRMGDRFQKHDFQSAIMFFSRSIGLSPDGREVPIIGGARVTGKTGKYDLGVLNILSDRVSYESGEEHIDIEKTNYSVLRLKRDLFNKSTVGVILLSKDSLDSSDYNRCVGIDFNMAFGSYVKCSAFMAKTFTPRLTGKDWAGYLDFVYESDSMNLDLQYLDIGENFNAEMGFIPRTDIRKLRTNFSLRCRPGILNIRKSHFFNKILYIENHSGQLESRIVTFGNYNTFQNGASLMFGYYRNFELLPYSFEIGRDVYIPEGRHSFNQIFGRFESDKSRDIAFKTEVKQGQFYNGKLFCLTGNAFFKVSRNFNMEFILERNQFDLPVTGGDFTANIAAGRLIYSFSPDLFAKAYVQWNDDENLFKSNFIIRWIYKSGANIYFIYNETREAGQAGFLQDRVIMLKVSFLFD